MSIKYLYDRKKIAVTYGEQKYSYADVIKYVNYYSEFLDISKGDRVALMMENRPESIFSFFSIWAKKGIAISLDAGYTVDQLAFVLNDSKPKYIFVSNKVKKVVEKANEKIGNIVKIIVVDEITLPTNYVAKQEEFENDSDEDVAIIVYTSGTTGNPKGVMITYNNIKANMDGVKAVDLVTDTDTILGMLPYHHIMPLCFTLILPMYLGVPVILLTEISSASLLKTLQENRITVILGVPRVWEMLDKAIMVKINESPLAKFIFKMAEKISSMTIRKMLFSKVHKQFGGHIRLMVSGGAKIDKSILENFRTMGFCAIQGYGMTETAPIIAFNIPGRERSDSVGEVIPNVEVKIEELNKKIESADIIYVGGGNTAYMMEVWQEYAVDKALMKAYKSGKVLSGLSAGSICWFIAGHSDSEFIEGRENPKHKWVKGLGIIPYLHCPHYDEPERAAFDEFYSGQIADAIAIENQVAIVWDDYEIKVIKSNPLKNAYYLSWSDKGFNKKALL